ncbi:DUF2318 domain-containing protein [Tissierella carlieri]|uniref:DUF2318 domain-containing protein n=1 Tax=Tissierella carlieri TaxID=689904 RepID=UPI001C0FB2A1|nr:DUF2318 domain-containing protein [Tissierella carlieri]MBU5313509.1 DUF2318 domain-containing protein [Tissierella carlieri]
MTRPKKAIKTKKQKTNYLPFLTMAVAIIAVAIVVLVPKGGSDETALNNTNTSNNQNTTIEENSLDENAGGPVKDLGVAAILNKNGDVVIKEADITENVSFLEYKSKDGITVGLLAARASDGTVRTALNTCQVCNGSPYAYFVQQDDQIQCENCGNIYSLDMIEQERGGCNPIPIMVEEKTVTGTEIIIPAAFLEENAAIFENWKKF